MSIFYVEFDCVNPMTAKDIIEALCQDNATNIRAFRYLDADDMSDIQGEPEELESSFERLVDDVEECILSAKRDLKRKLCKTREGGK